MHDVGRTRDSLHLMKSSTEHTNIIIYQQYTLNNGTDTEGCDSLLVTGNIPHHKSQQETKQVARNTTVRKKHNG